MAVIASVEVYDGVLSGCFAGGRNDEMMYFDSLQSVGYREVLRELYQALFGMILR